MGFICFWLSKYIYAIKRYIKSIRLYDVYLDRTYRSERVSYFKTLVT
uniref:Uncharacterized protein n=1 Tax=Myoviridae sp. ctCo31 TaxID=2825053 RepID=A0A8S5UMB6_9CAUD|nr:MAG TPA: hypothetical protein [Myoviridae sp. ctCo31]